MSDGTRSNESAPLVSVITIFHNEETYLPEAVTSVAAQDGVEWELLLVDDGSTDGSSAWARDRAEADPGRIRYLTHPDGKNHGMSATRNVGIRQARGRWLTFLDADDVWRPGKLSRQLETLSAHPEIDVLVSPAQWWRSWAPLSESSPEDEVPSKDWVQTFGPTSTTVIQPPYLLSRYLDDEWSSIHDLVIRRDVVNEVGGYEAAFEAMFEDQVFHAKIFADRRAVVTGDWWYRYRQHSEASTARAHAAGDHDRARKTFLAWLNGYLAANHPDEHEVRRQLRRHRRPYRFRTLWRIERKARTILTRRS